MTVVSPVWPTQGGTSPGRAPDSVHTAAPPFSPPSSSVGARPTSSRWGGEAGKARWGMPTAALALSQALPRAAAPELRPPLQTSLCPRVVAQPGATPPQLFQLPPPAQKGPCHLDLSDFKRVVILGDATGTAGTPRFTGASVGNCESLAKEAEQAGRGL